MRRQQLHHRAVERRHAQPDQHEVIGVIVHFDPVQGIRIIPVTEKGLLQSEEPDEQATELEGLIGTMVQLNYIAMEEVPQIPQLEGPFGVAVYAPLADATVRTEVGEFWIRQDATAEVAGESQ